MKPKIYLAGPFFNPVQVCMMQRIESMFESAGFPYYSPRLHSGSHLLSEEQKRIPEMWDPIFESNVSNLEDCGAVVAVVQYAMPHGQKLAICMEEVDPESPALWPATHLIPLKKDLEFPDSGTVWELGAIHMLNRIRLQGQRDITERYPESTVPVVGFHEAAKPEAKNLMLAKGMDNLLIGYGQLSAYLGSWSEDAKDFKYQKEGWTGEVI